ncbi:hypothetical protein FD723_41585 (plasmid) [Nostoc sp. C052]|uniref:hypothetical protein n=1 Tax=Nostoc sp. C052 TaxID=2576902 RepID=UPI0015C39204|nr:hypothetical protein [Nostoc sp. C052]QLE46682.1 hypothetical protein FD723_41585 [Nostoc sp. C052]
MISIPDRDAIRRRRRRTGIKPNTAFQNRRETRLKFPRRLILQFLRAGSPVEPGLLMLPLGWGSWRATGVIGL